jgi:hypothetical protein
MIRNARLHRYLWPEGHVINELPETFENHENTIGKIS